MRTTTAVTKIIGGGKTNVLPQEVKVFVNHRIHPKETIESVIDRDREIVNDERIAVRASPGCETAPSPISPHQSPYYTNVTQSVSRAFGSRVPFSAPSLMIGNTDTRWYWNLTSNIYRFTPLILTVEELKMFHGNDERIGVEALADMVLYYVLFVSKSCVSGKENV